MAYCRWSSMNFACDLYLYASVDGGYQLHVAANRYVQPLPSYDWKDIADNPEKFQSDYKKHIAALREYPETMEIGLPYDGANLTLGDAQGVLLKLVELRELGYVFPDNLFISLAYEMYDEMI